MADPIPLVRLAREAGIRRKRVKLRPIVPTQVMADDLLAIYRESLDIWENLFARLGMEYEPPAAVTTDATPVDLQTMIDMADRAADQIMVYQTEQLGRWVTHMGSWHRQKTIAGVRSALGVDITPYVRLSDVDAILQEAIRANVDLIGSVNADNRTRVQAAIYDAFVNRRTKKDFTDALAKALGITKRRARLIANDQNHKLGIALTAFRNEQMGIKSYIWDTMEDDRVRREHRDRQGRMFQWANPPWDGHPGFPIACRCRAQPVVDLG